MEHQNSLAQRIRYRLTPRPVRCDEIYSPGGSQLMCGAICRTTKVSLGIGLFVGGWWVIRRFWRR